MKGAISVVLWWLCVQEAISTDSFQRDQALILVEPIPSLIFRLENLQFARDHEYLLSKILFLCSAETESERATARDVSSMTDSLLFVKETIPDNYIKTADIPTCKFAANPSVMINTKQINDNYYEIGYEINLKSHHSRRIHPSQTFQNLKSTRDSTRPSTPNPDHIWISILNLRMEHGHNYVQQIFYEITNGEYINEDTIKECPTFPEITWLKNFNWDKMLEKANTEKIQKVEGYDNKERLELRKLAPLEDFTSYGKQLAACFHLNKVAVWSSISNNSWEKVEDFIRQKAKEFSRLQITAGTFGQFELKSEPEDSTISWRKKILKMLWIETQPILSLDDGKDQVSVPLIIWKLVQFEYKWQKYGEDVYFAVLIVTYNNPFVETSPLHEDCSVSYCEKYKWHIGNDNIYEGRTHCCPINAETMRLLKIKNFPTFFKYFDIDFVRKLINENDDVAEGNVDEGEQVVEEEVNENEEMAEEITAKNEEDEDESK